MLNENTSKNNWTSEDKKINIQNNLSEKILNKTKFCLKI